MTRREFRDLAPPETVRDAIGQLDLAGGSESVPLRRAQGRILADSVDAPLDVPGFDRSAMDGYALQARDTFGASETDPVELSVVGTVHAGEKPAVEQLDEGEAVQIATGAVMPPGADAMVPVERTVEGDGAVEVNTAVTPGENVMFRGADIASGDRALGPGTRLGPRHIGLLAALGQETVTVRKPPQVAVVSTGEELVQPGNALQDRAGQIYDVNSHSIGAAVETAGGESHHLTPASDDPDRLRAALEDAAEDSDLILTSGSTSAGTADILHDLIDEHGEILVHGVALKPGRPMLVGHVFGTPYVGLPGYPVSALTIFRTFVAPQLRKAAGQPEPADATITAELGTELRYEGGRLRLVPVGVVGDGAGNLIAYTLSRGSGATTSLVEADGVIRMPPETNLLEAGESVTVERFDSDDPLPSLLGVGEPDLVVSGLLDTLDTPRYLTLAPREAGRWLEDDIADVLVAAPGETGATEGRDSLATFEREWGLVVPAGNPSDISGIDDLQKQEVEFVNLNGDLAVRQAFETLTDQQEWEPTAAISGYERELPGLESAARGVADGRADAGLGLRATTDQLNLDFVSLGSQELALYPNPDRQEKPGLEALRDRIETQLPELLGGMPGYS
jgi:putative molybdopterin biosynthesis protein